MAQLNAARTCGYKKSQYFELFRYAKSCTQLVKSRPCTRRTCHSQTSICVILPLRRTVTAMFMQATVPTMPELPLELKLVAFVPSSRLDHLAGGRWKR